MKKTLQHYFFPHHSNNYRAKALHVDALFIYAVFILIFNVVIRSMSVGLPDVLGYATDISVSNLLSETNAKRSASGVQDLQLNESLSHAAALKAQHMFANNYWSHVGTDGKTPWDFISNAGYGYSFAGENLAKNFMTSGEVVDAWLASETHRDNLLKSNYNDVGFAVVNGVLNGEETTLVVQMFGTPTPVVASVPVNNNAESLPSVVERVVVNTGEDEQLSEEIVPVVVSTTDELSLAFEQEEAEPVALATETDNKAFTTVSNKPLFDIPTVQKQMLLIFFGFLLGVLVVDGWIVYHRKHVRVAGHSAAHLLFFITLLSFLINIKVGSII